MIFEELNGIDSECRSYLIGSQEVREAMIVDPLLEGVDGYLARLRQLGLKLALAIDTHTHADHLSGARELAAATGAKTCGAPRGSVQWPLAEGDRVTLGEVSARVWATPGHTADSFSLVFEDRILAADVLLIGTTGRTDLPTGDAEQAWQSMERVLSLPDETLLFPGHDYAKQAFSTLGEERRTNNRVLLGHEKFVQAMREPRPVKPRRMAEALAWNTRPL